MILVRFLLPTLIELQELFLLSNTGGIWQTYGFCWVSSWVQAPWLFTIGALMHSFGAFLWVVIGFLSLGIAGCDDGGRGYNTSTNPAVEKQASVLLDAIKAGNYDQAIKQYPDSFFVKQTTEGWVDKLKALSEERGSMQSYELKQSQADTRFSGKFFILEFMAIHEGNKRVNHIITLIAPVTGGDIKIVGHKMKPWLDERDTPLPMPMSLPEK